MIPLTWKHVEARADPDFVRASTGQVIGGVAPVGHPQPLRTLVDVWLDKYDVVWAAAVAAVGAGSGSSVTWPATPRACSAAATLAVLGCIPPG